MKFRLTRMEYEQLSDDIISGKVSDITPAQQREMREIVRRGEHAYPFRKEEKR